MTNDMQKPPFVQLRAMEPSDIDAIYRWENDPSAWVHSAHHQPFSRHALQQFIDSNAGADIYDCRQLRLMACAIVGNPATGGVATASAHGEATLQGDAVPVGCADLYDFDPYHRRAALGLVVDSHHRHQGLGTAILQAVEEFSKEHLQLHQLCATVSNDNQPSLRLFSAAGYRHCGTLRDWMYTPTGWIDASIFQKLL